MSEDTGIKRIVFHIWWFYKLFIDLSRYRKDMYVFG